MTPNLFATQQFSTENKQKIDNAPLIASHVNYFRSFLTGCLKSVTEKLQCVLRIQGPMPLSSAVSQWMKKKD